MTNGNFTFNAYISEFSLLLITNSMMTNHTSYTDRDKHSYLVTNSYR